MSLELVVSGTVEDYAEDSANYQTLLSIFAEKAGVDVSLVQLTIEGGSVKVTAVISVPPTTTTEAVETLLEESFSNATTATATLSDGGLAAAIVETDPTVVTLGTAGSDFWSDGAKAGVGVGVGLALVLIGGVAAFAVRHVRQRAEEKSDAAAPNAAPILVEESDAVVSEQI